MPGIHEPFDRSGTEVGADGVRRYTGLHRNVVAKPAAPADGVDRRPALTPSWPGAHRVRSPRCPGPQATREA